MKKLADPAAVLDRKHPFPNNVIFPSELRDAIPSHKPSVGRCLQLESADAQPAHTERLGRRVQISLRVCETGKLTAAFDVWIDLELDAAKALASTILAAAAQAEDLPPSTGW